MTFSGDVFSDEFDPEEIIKLDNHELIEDKFVKESLQTEDPDIFSNLSSLDELDPLAVEQASERLEVIRLVGLKIKGGWTKKNIEPELDTLIVNGFLKKRPSWRSVARWNSQYDKRQGLVSLVAKNKFKNKVKKRKLDIFISQAIDEKYLTRERPSISSAYRYYCDLIAISNNDAALDKIIAVSYNTFRAAINTIPPYEVAKKRFGKSYADKHFRKIGKFKKSNRVMQRVEIDHTPLDLILLDDNLEIPLGRPYLTILVDCYSRCIVGLHLGYREPSYDAVRKAILNSCLSKNNIKEKFTSIKKEWPCEGKIETLVVDNGAEFWSSSLERFCQVLGTNIEYNPVAKPWKKPFVERIFSTYKSRFIDEIPGKTFSNVQQLKDYKPQEDAVLPFSLFVELLYKWVVDIYNYSPSSREERIPILAWEMGCKEFPPVYYSDLEKDQFILESLPYVKRCLSKEGVKLDHIAYCSDELVEYRKNTPPPVGESRVELMVKRDPTDVSQVYVFLPELNKYISVPAVDPDDDYRGVSLFEHQTSIKFTRLYNRGKVDHLALAESRQYIEQRTQEFIYSASNSKSKKRPKNLGGINKIAKRNDISSSGDASVLFSSKRHLASEDLELVTSSQGNKKISEDTLLNSKILEDWDDWVDDLEPY